LFSDDGAIETCEAGPGQEIINVSRDMSWSNIHLHILCQYQRNPSEQFGLEVGKSLGVSPSAVSRNAFLRACPVEFNTDGLSRHFACATTDSDSLVRIKAAKGRRPLNVYFRSAEYY
jgi:hypothetical protein